MPDNEELSAPEKIRTSSVHLRGDLSKPPSRALWLIKWLLAIPHIVVLAFLGIAVVFVTFFAFFAVIFTGKYPRRIFDFVVGVFRWGWRVGFYATNILGTDKYPPFSLKPRDDYPADFHIDYPERLKQWLPLVKWFLAVPHFFVLMTFTGFSTDYKTDFTREMFQNSPSLIEIFSGGSDMHDGFINSFQSSLFSEFYGDDFFGRRYEEVDYSIGFPGLLQILVFIALIALLFTGRYHKDIFRLVMGINRWIFRVSAYILLLTDEYPPFRLED